PTAVRLAALNGNPAAIASMPAIFAAEALVVRSAMALRVGPLIVERAEVRVAAGVAVPARLLLRDDFLAGFFAIVLHSELRFRLGVESRPPPNDGYSLAINLLA